MARSSLRGNYNVAALTKGIHDNIVIESVDVKERKAFGEISKKMFFITLALVDPTTRKKKKSIEVSWWKPDPVGNKYFQTNLVELAFQLVSILSVYMPEEDAYEAFKDVFEGYGFQNEEDIVNYKWKKSELAQLFPKMGDAFYSAIAPHCGLDGKLLKVKLTTDTKGMGTEMPKYGKFMALMEDENTVLKFTASELKNHSNGGITTKND